MSDIKKNQMAVQKHANDKREYSRTEIQAFPYLDKPTMYLFGANPNYPIGVFIPNK